MKFFGDVGNVSKIDKVFKKVEKFGVQAYVVHLIQFTQLTVWKIAQKTAFFNIFF
jgi:hypothetical protein